MEDQLELMVTYLIHLQFYDEAEDIIYSRDKKVKVSIPGSKSVIQAFVNELLKHLHLLKASQYRSYLEEISKKLAIDIDKILQEFQASIEILPEHELTIEMIANFLIGPIRSELHAKEFDELMRKASTDAENKLVGDNVKERVESRKLELFSINDENVSLLYNLVVLRLLASIFGTQEVFDRIDTSVQEYYKKLVAKLVMRA
jgi:hypothetical protein